MDCKEGMTVRARGFDDNKEISTAFGKVLANPRYGRYTIAFTCFSHRTK